MPLTDPHPEYAKMAPRWQALRHAYEGEYAIKYTAAGLLDVGRPTGSRYLPRPVGMAEEDYRAYLLRPKWYPATARTVQGLTGAILRKPPQVAVSRALEPQLRNITLTGMSLAAFTMQLLMETFLLGRYGVLVDYTGEGPIGRPLWSGWRAEEIRLWIVGTMAGEQQLLAVVLCDEVYRTKPGTDYTQERAEQYRLHWLNNESIYQIDVYEKAGNELVPIMDPIIPLRRGEPLRFVPFQFFAPTHLTPVVTKSPLEDLALLNFANFRHLADYEHGLHLTALPTAVITGFRDDSVTLAIGSQAVWQIPAEQAKVYFLEFQGHGLQSHERAIETDKHEMATMGARLLEERPDIQETLGAVRLRQSGEQGTVASWANMMSDGLTRLLRLHSWWAGISETLEEESVNFAFNTDFMPVPLEGKELTALMAAWQGGGMSLDSFLWNLQQGERLPPTRTIEEEKTLIETQTPISVSLDEEPRSRRNGQQRQGAAAEATP